MRFFSRIFPSLWIKAARLPDKELMVDSQFLVDALSTDPEAEARDTWKLLKALRIAVIVGVIMRFGLNHQDYHSIAWLSVMLPTTVLFIALQFATIMRSLPAREVRSRWTKLWVVTEIALLTALYVITKRAESDFYLFYFLPCLLAMEYLSVAGSTKTVILVVFSLMLAIVFAGFFDPEIDMPQNILRVISRIWLPRVVMLMSIGGIALFWRRMTKARRLIWSAFLNAVPEGLSIVDKEKMKIRWSNDKMRSGFFRDRNLIDQVCYYAYKRGERPCKPCPTMRAFEGEVCEEVTYSPEYILRNSNGSEIVPNREVWRRYDTLCAPIHVQDDILAAIECVKDSTAREVLHEATRKLQAARNEEEIMNVLLDGLSSLGYCRCRIYALSEDGTKLVGKASRGMKAIPFVGLELPIFDDPHSRQTLGGFEPQLYTSTDGDAYREVLQKDPELPWIEIPLKVEQWPFGKICCDNRGHPIEDRAMMTDEVDASKNGRRSDYLNVLHNLGVQGSLALRHLLVERDLAEMLWTYVHRYVGYENLLISNADVLLNQSERYTGVQRQEAYEDLVAVIRTMARLGHHALDWAEHGSESGLRLDISDEPIDIVTVVDEVVKSFRFREKVHKCKTNLIHDGPVYGYIDEDRLQLLAFILVDNAFKAISSSGDSIQEGDIRVEISEKSEDTVRIEVKDNGRGVRPEHVSAIFEPWVRRLLRGHGVGLYIGRRIAEMHGGSLELNEEYVDGACFILELRKSKPRGGESGDATNSRGINNRR